MSQTVLTRRAGWQRVPPDESRRDGRPSRPSVWDDRETRLAVAVFAAGLGVLFGILSAVFA